MTAIAAITTDFDPRHGRVSVELPMAYQRSECESDDVAPVADSAGADVRRGECR